MIASSTFEEAALSCAEEAGRCAERATTNTRHARKLIRMARREATSNTQRTWLVDEAKQWRARARSWREDASRQRHNARALFIAAAHARRTEDARPVAAE